MRAYKHVKKHNKKPMLVLLALFLVLSSLIVVSYSWIEGSSSILLQNDTSNVIKYAATKPQANITSSANYSIPLSDYIDNSTNLFLAPARSTDGSIIQIKRDDGTFADATVNDVGVNYIEFAIKVKTTTPVTFGYTNASAIKIGGAATDSIKISTQIASNTPKVYDGKTLHGQEAFTLSSAGTYVLTTRIWCDQAKYDALKNGGTVSFDFELQRMYTVKAISVTNAAQSGTGGSVSINGGTAGSTATKNVLAGSSVTFKATNAGGYNFTGWYSAVTGGTLKYSNASYTFTVNSNITYYARFASNYTVNFKVATNSSTTSTAGGKITIDGGSSVTSDSVTKPYGSTVALTATANSGYRFAGWYKTNISGTAVSTSTSWTHTVVEGATYYARFIQRVSPQAISVTNGSSTNHAGGNVKVGSGTAGGTSTTTVDYNTSVTFTATKNSGYDFDGWYTSATGGTLISSSESFSTNITSSSYVAYARFTAEAKVRYYFQNTNNWSTVKAYAWNSASGDYPTAWPGADMTYVSGTARTYYIDIPANCDKIQFNNGSDSGKIDNLSLSGNANKVYIPGTGWTNYTGPYRTIYVYTGDCSWYGNDGAVPRIKSSGKVTSWLSHSSVSGKYYCFTNCPYDAYSMTCARYTGGNYYNSVSLGTPPSDKNAIAINSNGNGTGSWYNH